MAGSTSKIDIGDQVSITAVFTPKTGNTDPTTVVLRVMLPSGTTTTYTNSTIVAVATDSYSQTFTPTTAGTHRYRWESTGSVTAAEEGFFVVQRSAF